MVCLFHAPPPIQAMLAYPVPELTALRKSPPLASITAGAVGGAGGLLVPGVTTRHYDVQVALLLAWA